MQSQFSISCKRHSQLHLTANEADRECSACSTGTGTWEGDWQVDDQVMEADAGAGAAGEAPQSRTGIIHALHRPSTCCRRTVNHAHYWLPIITVLFEFHTSLCARIQDVLDTLDFALVPRARRNLSVDASANADVCRDARSALRMYRGVAGVDRVHDFGPRSFYEYSI